MRKKRQDDWETVDPFYLSFKGVDERVCSAFGCGKKLTHEEMLYGDKCIECKNKKTVDPTSVIKFK